MKKKIIGLMLFVFILFGGLSAITAQEGEGEIPKLALVNLSAKNIVGVNSMIFAEKVCESLNKTGAFKVMAQNEAYQIFQNKKFKQSGSVSPEYLAKAGKVLGADKVVSGEFNKKEDNYSISLKLINVKTGQIEKEFSKIFNEIEKFNYALDKLAVKISGVQILGEIYIDSNVKDADIYLDGKLIGKTPFTAQKVALGEHKIELEKKNYRKSAQNVGLDEDNLKADVNIKLISFFYDANELTPEKVKELWKPQSSGIDKDLNGVFALDENTAWAVGNKGAIIHTTDGGNSWQNQTSGVDINLSQVFFIDKQYGWAVGDKPNVLRTEDGGATWQNVRINHKKASVVQGVYFFNKDEGCIVGGGPQYYQPGFIAYTNDGGKTFTIKHFLNDFAVDSLFFLNKDIGWAICSSGKRAKICEGRNKGQDWEIKNFNDRGGCKRYFGMQFFDESEGWIAATWYNDYTGMPGRGALYYTSDGCKSVALKRSIHAGIILKIYFMDKNHGWVFGDYLKLNFLSPALSKPLILYTSDAGQNWKEIEFYNDVKPLNIYFVDSNCGWLVGRKGAIYKYENK